jgi:PAS domain-containing protein
MNNRNLSLFTAFCAAFCALLSGCANPIIESAYRSANEGDVTSAMIFGYYYRSPAALGAIDDQSSPRTISITMPANTPTQVISYPVILHNGRDCVLKEGTSWNYGSAAHTAVYTLTGRDGKSRDYNVTVNLSPAMSNPEDAASADILLAYYPDDPPALAAIGQAAAPGAPVPVEINLAAEKPDQRIEDELIIIHNGASYRLKTPWTHTATLHQAVFTVRAANGTERDYAVFVALPPVAQNYIYVSATGDDFTGEGTAELPYKTLRWAVSRAAHHHTIRAVRVVGELNDASEAANVPGTVFDLGGIFTGANAVEVTVFGTTGSALIGAPGKRVLDVYEGAQLRFMGIAITGSDQEGIRMRDDGTSVWLLTGASVSYNQRGILLRSGTLRMSGGAVENHRADRGAGVLVESGHFVLTGGTISDNLASAARAAGAVQVAGGKFTMQGGSIVRNGAIGVAATGGLFMFDGGNIAAHSSYGVTITLPAVFTKSGGRILGNGNEEKDPAALNTPNVDGAILYAPYIRKGSAGIEQDISIDASGVFSPPDAGSDPLLDGYDGGKFWFRPVTLF